MRQHHATLSDVQKYLTGNELIVTTVRNHWDTVVSWWFLNNRYLPLYRFVDEYGHDCYARGNKLWWLHDKVDFIMRYETLQDDLNIVLLSLGLPALELTVENVTAGKDRLHYMKYYDAKSFWRVYDRFKEEIDFYGYSEKVAYKDFSRS